MLDGFAGVGFGPLAAPDVGIPCLHVQPNNAHLTVDPAP